MPVYRDSLLHRYGTGPVKVKHKRYKGRVVTVISNLEQISTALLRNAFYVLRYINDYFCIDTDYDDVHNRWIIFGRVSRSAVQKCIDWFVLTLVHCQNCYFHRTYWVVAFQSESIVCTVCDYRLPIYASAPFYQHHALAG